MPPQSRFETMQPDVELHIDVPRPKRSRNQSLKRSVTFSNDIRVQQIRHLNDYSKEDIRATWFAPEEYKGITLSLADTIRRMMKGEQISEYDEGVCYRGLECRTKMGARHRNERKKKVRFGVLEEQWQQHYSGRFQEELIAKKSRDSSVESRLDAYALGSQDEKFVLAIAQQS